MTYEVKVINNIDELKDCPTFLIDQYQWTKEYKPEAFGQMALLENYGLVISMTAIESNPLRTYKEDDDPVYKDSALEAFLNFLPEDIEFGYMNFEMNANGALLGGFGVKPNRSRIKELTQLSASCNSVINEQSWNAILKIPMELISELYHIKPLSKGDIFTCNFYKIAEDPSIEHYASYARINNPTPNFHLPQFFAKAIIV